jgi:hypothetical protein
MHTHSDRLERWLGKDQVERLSRSMEKFYWPVPVHGVPGRVFAMPGGDFTGEIRAGQEMSAIDRAIDIEKRARRSRLFLAAMRRRQSGAFASLSALVTAGTTAGKRYDTQFNKAGVASNAIGNGIDLWTLGASPAAGAAGTAGPGGKVWTSADVGALPFVNPANANTSHFVTGYVTGSVAPNTLLLYDRLFSVAKAMNTAAIEQISGTPTRYQNTSNVATDYIGGSFVFPSVPTTVLPATAHNWVGGVTSSPNQGCCYTNQAGVESGLPLIAGVSACVKNGVDLVAQSWFMPLAAGDVGVKKLNTLQCSVAVATGTIDFVLGHPIAFFPCLVANFVCIVDGLNTAFNLAFIFDNACLSFLEMPKPAVTATTYSGLVTTVSE